MPGTFNGYFNRNGLEMHILFCKIDSTKAIPLPMFDS